MNRMNTNEWEEDDGYDDIPDDSEAEYLPCPECGKDIYEDSEQCPYCGSYVTFQTRVFAERPTWWVVLGVLGIVALLFSLLFIG